MYIYLLILLVVSPVMTELELWAHNLPSFWHCISMDWISKTFASAASHHNSLLPQRF